MNQGENHHRVIYTFFLFVSLVCVWSGLHILNITEIFDRKHQFKQRNFSLKIPHFADFVPNQPLNNTIPIPGNSSNLLN